MSNRLKCRVDGCPGFVDVVTNGRGQAVDTPCPCCEKRAAWVREHAPKIVATPCDVCGGPIVRAKPNAKYCTACKDAVARVQKQLRSRAVRTERTTVTPIRRRA